ncbi:hypothetical protein F8M41_016715 [Gigaspora margarita]|uniref:Uncharacterized protein n=1 Tax=Gigaspora margarita TaxID=4874 RepID=A0A8H4EMK3_GIGMA|nr:hypothetical protein F8M41_016715 [Gigaspora margarita]
MVRSIKKFSLNCNNSCIWSIIEICKEHSNPTSEFRLLMSLGPFIATFAFSLLIQSIFTHIFAYVQGIFLLSKRGIPLQSIIIGGNPLQVSMTCFIILKQKQISIYQLISYLATLVVYILSFSIGAYATSNLGTPYIMGTTSFKWIKAPTVITNELNKSMNVAFTQDGFLGAINNIQMDSLFSWVEKTKNDINEIAFMPIMMTKTINELTQNLTQNNQSITHSYSNDLASWKIEAVFNNVNMQYLTSQCSANVIPSCESDGQENVHVMASKINQTISWQLCNLHYDTMNVSTQIDCNITIKEGIFPLITFEFPSSTQQPREEYLSQVLMKKKELTELKEIKNNLFTIMEDALSGPFSATDPITKNVVVQLASAWDCEPENITCAQSKGTVATVRYVGSLLESASNIYFARISKNITEFLKNTSSTGFYRYSHRVCLGGNNPMQSIGLMIAIPLITIIIGLVPLLYNNKLWWLAADIGNNYIAFIRSISPCGKNWNNELPEYIARPGETKFKKIVRLNVKDNHIGLSSSHYHDKT